MKRIFFIAFMLIGLISHGQSIMGIIASSQVPSEPAVGIMVTDDFNRADESPLANGNWTTISNGGLRIVSNQVIGVTNAGWNGSKYTGAAYGSDQYAQASSPSATDHWPSILVRISSDNTKYYEFYRVNSTTLSLRISGSTVIGTDITQAYTPGEVLKLEASGSGASINLSMYYNGTLLATRVAPIFGGNYFDTGSVGLRIYSNTATNLIDNFEGGDL